MAPSVVAPGPARSNQSFQTPLWLVQIASVSGLRNPTKLGS
jgi:hypothetical protein